MIEQFMERRHLLAAIGTMLAQAAASKAQNTSSPSPLVFRHDVPDLNLHGWEVSAAEIRYAPGGKSAPHRHPGITLVYVLEGQIVSKVGDAPEKTYAPGEMFLENPNELHAVSRNASDTKPAKFLAILLAEKGKPPTTPA